MTDLLDLPPEIVQAGSSDVPVNDPFESLGSKYDVKSGIVADMVGGTIASVADFGSSVWNSVTFNKYPTSTEDLLTRIDDNALKVYQEHPDTIHAASFIGGMLVPTGLALKGMTLARAGTKGINWFSQEGKIAQLGKIDSVLQESGIASAAYKAELRALYTTNIANVVVDNAAMEIALLGTMNAHPLMEDYMKDPAKNFGISMLLGTAIVGPISHIGLSYEARMSAKELYTGTLNILEKTATPLHTIGDASTLINDYQRNINTWSSLLPKTAAEETASGLSKTSRSIISSFIDTAKGKQLETLNNMLSPELREMTADFKTSIIERMYAEPTRFAGINKIEFATTKEELGFLETKFNKLFGSTIPVDAGGAALSEIPLTRTILSGAKKGELTPTTIVYSPAFDGFMLKKDLAGYGVAADLYQDEKALTKGLPNNWFQIPNRDASLEMMVESTAKVDAEYLKKLKAVDEMSIEKLTEMVVSPQDAPTMNAVLSRLIKLGETDPTVASSIKITLTDAKPDWNKIEEALFKQVPLRNRITGKVGVSPDYLQKIQAEVKGQALERYNLGSVSISGFTGLVRKWIGGGVQDLRNAVDDAFRPGGYGKNRGALPENIAGVKAAYNSPQSVAFRDMLMQNADSDGYVYLFRGLRKEAVGSHSLESFAMFAEKGKEFGSTKLYRVKVTDILGVIRDVGPKYDKNAEVLVMSHTREAHDILPIADRAKAIPEDLFKLENFGLSATGLKSYEKTQMKDLTVNLYEDFADSNPFNKFHGTKELWDQQAKDYVGEGLKAHIKDINDFNSAKNLNQTVVNNTAGFHEIMEALNTLKMNEIQAGIKLGVPLETLGLRTNTPLYVVELIATGSFTPGMNMSRYTKASEIQTYLTPENRSLALKTTATKVPVAELRASNFKAMGDESDSLIKQVIMEGSPSQISKDLAAFLFTKDTQYSLAALKAAIKEITPASIGSKFLQSTDFSLRDMGDAGAIISILGKNMEHFKGRYTNQILEPISLSYKSITKDPAAIVEFNTAKEVNASLKGYREFNNGKFWVQDENEPWKMVPDPSGSGKSVKTMNLVQAEWKGTPFEITTPSVLRSYENMQEAGRELYNLHSTERKILGLPPMNDNGFWMPAFNPRNKYISFVWNNNDQTTRLLHANTPEELKSLEDAFSSTLKEREIERGIVKIVRAGEERELFNKLQGRHDPIFMASADISSFHSGASTAAMVATNSNIFSDLANAYEHYIHRSVSNITELNLSDVMGSLDAISALVRRPVAKQPVSKIQEALNKPLDAGMIAKNTLLGKSNLKEYTAWQDTQNGIQTAVELGLQSVAKIMDPILNPIKGIFGKGKTFSDAEYEALIKDMDTRGIPNPFKDLDNAVAKDIYHMERLSQAPNLTPRIVALSNNLAATFLLKVMELGQPLVNILSLPVLTSAAVQRTFSKEFMGTKLAPDFHMGTIKAMYGGIRYMGNPEYQKYVTQARDLGVMTPVVSEVSELLQLSRSFNPGMIQKTENLLNGKLVEMLSKPSNWSETAVREMSFANGVYLAKQAYPGLHDSGVITFARNFMDVAVGNYTASQRPTVFQGSLGVAMGLFQTYFVTLMQQIYRRFELRDYKQLAKMALTQSSIFGVKGLPGFNQISELMGEHFSDQNYDLTTGTYRAIPETAANILLYGLPSNLGPAVYTRGDIQPRLPNPFGGLQTLASVNILTSAYQSSHKLLSAASQIGDPGTFSAVGEALSMQNISRPVARLSELATGYSVTQKGNEVAGPEELYSAAGISARVFATRSLREAKAREAMHLNSMYGTLDRDQREGAMAVLKNHVRSGTLTPDVMERIQEKYMRTGSPTGWRSVINKTIHDTDSPGVSAVRNHLSPKSPANMMIESLD
jgi:hypothetical protein